DISQGLAKFLFSYVWLFAKVFFNYMLHYLPVYILLAGFLWLAFTKAKLKILFTENGYRFIWLSVLPVLLLHAVFLHYSVQDFTALYASLFFSVLMAILYDKLKRSGVFTIKSLNLLVFLFVCISVLQYQLINMPGRISLSGEPYSFAKEAGIFVAKHTAYHEVAVVCGRQPEPQEIWYAQKNMLWLLDETQLEALLRNRNIRQAAIFRYSKDGMELIKKYTSLQ
ncbi:MAG: hypothetical protein NZ522_07720, partial [Chitinophagales bacterium]|nr:hypothetical protein [Chitinophagales bacterium]